MLRPSFLLDWACIVEGEADPEPVGANADIAVEKTVACLGILDRTFALFRHVLFSRNSYTLGLV